MHCLHSWLLDGSLLFHCLCRCFATFVVVLLPPTLLPMCKCMKETNRSLLIKILLHIITSGPKGIHSTGSVCFLPNLDFVIPVADLLLTHTDTKIGKATGCYSLRVSSSCKCYLMNGSFDSHMSFMSLKNSLHHCGGFLNFGESTLVTCVQLLYFTVAIALIAASSLLL